MAVHFFYLPIILLVTIINGSTSSDTTGKDVHRFSSGVKFTWLQSFLPPTQMWRQLFILNLPQNQKSKSNEFNERQVRGQDHFGDASQYHRSLSVHHPSG